MCYGYLLSKQFLANVPFPVPAAHEYGDIHAYHVRTSNALNDVRMNDTIVRVETYAAAVRAGEKPNGLITPSDIVVNNFADRWGAERVYDEVDRLIETFEQRTRTS